MFISRIRMYLWERRMNLNMKIKCISLLLVLCGLVSAALIFEVPVLANRYYSGLVGGAPLIQTWTDTSQITTDDDWDNVVSMQAFRGDGLTVATGVDPRTVIADGHTTPLDVNANQTNPNTFTTGGAAEFEIADPTIALKGSATASAPHLMIYLDTTPCPATKSISIRYKVRDLDSTATDAVQQVALQYRIGVTGTFENVAAGFIADATDPNSATKVTSILANLPPNIIGRPQVEIRIITTNASGGVNEWIGIDDIEVGCFFPTAAQVSAGGRVLTNDGNGVPNASVSFFNTNTLETVYARTNQFGYFSVDGLGAGDIFIVSVGHKQYTFSNQPQAIRITESVKGIVFYADAPANLKYSGRHVFKK